MVFVDVKINEKGQIVIPKVLRDAYGLLPGGSAVLVEEKNSLVLMSKRKSVEEFDRFIASLPKFKVGKVDSDADYDEEMRERWTT